MLYSVLCLFNGVQHYETPMCIRLRFIPYLHSCNRDFVYNKPYHYGYYGFFISEQCVGMMMMI